MKTNEASQRSSYSTLNADKIAHINAALTGQKSKYKTPPFLLSFENFNQNIHNFLVDSGASSNVMPFSLCKKLNETLLKISIHIIQLEKTELRVQGELKDVLIIFVVNHGIHQTIGIIVVDIPKAMVYSLVDTGHKSLMDILLQIALAYGYLGRESKQTKVNNEKNMKHTATSLDSPNEP